MKKYIFLLFTVCFIGMPFLGGATNTLFGAQGHLADSINTNEVTRETSTCSLPEPESPLNNLRSQIRVIDNKIDRWIQRLQKEDVRLNAMRNSLQIIQEGLEQLLVVEFYNIAVPRIHREDTLLPFGGLVSIDMAPCMLDTHLYSLQKGVFVGNNHPLQVSGGTIAQNTLYHLASDGKMCIKNTFWRQNASVELSSFQTDPQQKTLSFNLRPVAHLVRQSFSGNIVRKKDVNVLRKELGPYWSDSFLRSIKNKPYSKIKCTLQRAASAFSFSLNVEVVYKDDVLIEETKNHIVRSQAHIKCYNESLMSDLDLKATLETLETEFLVRLSSKTSL